MEKQDPYVMMDLMKWMQILLVENYMGLQPKC